MHHNDQWASVLIHYRKNPDGRVEMVSMEATLSPDAMAVVGMAFDLDDDADTPHVVKTVAPPGSPGPG